MTSPDPIKLEIYKHLFASIAEEMGAVLRKASYSPNIKERRDYSCAVFNTDGQMIAQAAHIPVHLGSMPLSVLEAISQFRNSRTTPEKINQTIESTDSSGAVQPNEIIDKLQPEDTIILNDPYRGGTHLPDITLVTPVFQSFDSTGFGDESGEFIGFVASRAHHADVGGMTPGSMPVGREIFQEGIIIPPVKLIRKGKLEKGIWEMILSNVRTPEERAGDLWAQIAANQKGAERFIELANRYGTPEMNEYMSHLLLYTERMTRQLIAALPDGDFHFCDRLDNDGICDQPVKIAVSMKIRQDSAEVDFSESDSQQTGSVNAVYAITLSAVYYVFRSLLGLDIPNNSGCLVPIKVIAPKGSVVNATFPSAVAGGNVETSQRIVDVLLGALSQAAPDKIPAASQGTMNNVTIGGYDSERSAPFTYYETIGGGMGASPISDGASAVHSHMTNTLNTPVEALEYSYPLRVRCYQIRNDSGGSGEFRGGDGIRRDVEVLEDCQVTLLTERRYYAPYGLEGGEQGAVGENVLIRNGESHSLPGKGTFAFETGTVLSIRTPGGGGYGVSKD